MKTSIGIVDDHTLFAKSLELMLRSFHNYEVVVVASNGKDLKEKIAAGSPLPEIMLIDVNMPVMNGVETARWLSSQYSRIKLVAVSMNDDDNIIIDMLRAGCCAYLLKETHPDELEKALQEIRQHGYYNADSGNIQFRRMPEAHTEPLPSISDREKQFLHHACSDLTYKQIASLMSLSERTIDGYRESLFHKLKVQSRVGLALEAIRKGLVAL